MKGNGTLNTKSVSATNSTIAGSAIDGGNVNWNIDGELLVEGSKILLNKVNITASENNKIRATKLNVDTGKFKFSNSEFLIADKSTTTMSIQEIVTTNNLNCTGASFDILAETDIDVALRDININNSSDGATKGEINFYENINLKCGMIKNNGYFQFGNRGGTTGKNFECGSIQNNGEFYVQNNGDFSFTRELYNYGEMTISNKGIVQENECREGILNYGDLTISNKGDINLNSNINNQKGILNIKGAKTIKASSDEVILARLGSTINIEPGEGNTINFINDNTSGRAITMYSASEAANTSTTWSTDRTIVNIKNGNITSNVSGILQYGGKLNIDNANITVTEQGTVSGGTYIIQAGLKSQVDADRTYPRVQINNSTLTQTTTNANSDGIRVGLGTILLMKNSTLKSDIWELETNIWFEIDQSEDQPICAVNGYSGTNWTQSICDKNISVNERIELPVVLLKDSVLGTKNGENYNHDGKLSHNIGSIQSENTEIHRYVFKTEHERTYALNKTEMTIVNEVQKIYFIDFTSNGYNSGASGGAKCFHLYSTGSDIKFINNNDDAVKNNEYRIKNIDNVVM